MKKFLIILLILTSFSFSGQVLLCNDGAKIYSDSTRLYSDLNLCDMFKGFYSYVPSDSVLNKWTLEDKMYIDSIRQVREDSIKLAEVYRNTVVADSLKKFMMRRDDSESDKAGKSLLLNTLIIGVIAGLLLYFHPIDK